MGSLPFNTHAYLYYGYSDIADLLVAEYYMSLQQMTRPDFPENRLKYSIEPDFLHEITTFPNCPQIREKDFNRIHQEVTALAKTIPLASLKILKDRLDGTKKILGEERFFGERCLKKVPLKTLVDKCSAYIEAFCPVVAVMTKGKQLQKIQIIRLDKNTSTVLMGNGTYRQLSYEASVYPL